MDPLFQFAFSNLLLRRLPPQLAQEVEALVQAQGFEMLLTGILMSTLAERHLHESIFRAAANVKGDPALAEITKRAVLACLSVGTKEVVADG
jgi:hypothetical protein